MFAFGDEIQRNWVNIQISNWIGKSLMWATQISIAEPTNDNMPATERDDSIRLYTKDCCYPPEYIKLHMVSLRTAKIIPFTSRK